MSKAGADTRTCAYCGESFPLEEFWTGSKLSYFCANDRDKSKQRRKQIEHEAVDDNEQSDEQDEAERSDESDEGGESDESDESDEADEADEAA